MEDKGYSFVEHEKPYTYEEDGMVVTRGNAWSGPGCHLGCGVLLYTDKEGNFIKAEGDPENPFNQGRLCVRCLALEGVVNHEDRLTYPMMRDPKDRGKDAFRRASWDEALDHIAEKFLKFKEEYGPESVVFWQGTGRDMGPWITHLAWSYGSPNYIVGLSGTACYLPRIAGTYALTGAFWLGDYSQQFTDRYDDPRWELPETIVMWGNNPIIANSDGLFGHWVVDCMKKGSKIMVVDPRRTWLASKAEHFLQIRPGTDAALALGMINVIIEEELYDYDFVDRWCYGFDELAERAKEYPPAKVSEITWIEEERIIEAARAFAKSKSAIMQWGLAIDMTKETLPACHALTSLFAITGNIDKPGAMVVPPAILAYASGWGRELLDPEIAQKRIGLKEYPLMKFGFQVSSPDLMVTAWETGEPYTMKGAWFQTSNFLTCTGPDPERALKAVRNLELIVCVDLFMTPTIMACADVVLPAATYPERDGLRLGDGMQRGEIINKVTQIGECKSDMEINMLLGQRLAPKEWDFANVEEMFTHLLKETGMTFAEMRENAPAYMPFEYHKYEKGLLRADGQPGFETTTGRIELWSNFFNSAGLDPLPYFEEPTPGPYSTPEDFKKYPLVLTTGARTWPYFHSEHRQIPHLRSIRPDPLIQIHPQTAEEYGVVDGDWVWVENMRGRAKRKVKVTPILKPGVLNADHGWWHPEDAGEEEDGFFGLWDLDINQLIEWSCGKSGFGSNYKSLICEIYKVEEGE